jgi:hypothetical protein
MRHGRLVGWLAAAMIVAAACGDGFAADKAAPPPESKSSVAKPVAPVAPVSPPAPMTVTDTELRGIGEDVTVAEGETLNGDVVCIRGRATIDGHVNGDVTVVAGTLTIKGSVAGDVNSIATHTTLDQGARIDGQLTNVGGSLDRNGATVHGQVVNIPLGINFGPWTGGFIHGWSGLVWFFFWLKLFALFLFFVCALLLAALVPDRIRLISDETPHRFFSALVFGLVGYLVYAITQIFLFFTIIGIPLVFLLYLVFLILKWLGMCGIFHHIGVRIGRGLGREMSLLGAILLGFLPFALLRILPWLLGWCVGVAVWFGIEILAVGYLIVTRVGTRREADLFPPPVRPAPPPPPAPEAPVAGSMG